MQQSLTMAHSHFTLCLRPRPQTYWVAHHLWYGVWIRVKGPHHSMVMAFGSCVKWALVTRYCQIVPNEERVPTHVRARRSDHQTWRSDIQCKINRVKLINYRLNFNILGRITKGKIKCIGNQPIM